ncbi:MAG: hypothetical protein IGR93_09690 [Hydrococcus sp. C42_A2020_068]|uniref:hypothetical protein n=1 Tax=Pleurocapsa sp. PCC 7327 TaxID=118163 RepID=UPI00029FB16D|nr:hypothetical protein [Pleurocapsa sp. PCC 7327]AFY78296.1 hypothetical protein Ple7327_3066 [Pleurocapsa sp. PCC 7327]MBF2020355.1 hypothetical protein [Hydrococcus sp. C42_A2020_068]
MTRRIQMIFGATWQYLNQPLGDEYPKSIWNISHFWHLYQIQLLETCWYKDITSESHYTQ